MMDGRRDAATPGAVLMLDSASVRDVEQISALGLVSGITTNPSLLRKEGKPPLDQLRELLAISEVPIFFQPTEATTQAARMELRRARELAPDRVRLKLPLTEPYLPLVREAASEEGLPFAVTAVYSLGQAVTASQHGAGWIIPYVDRARRLLEDGDGLVGRLRALLDRIQSPTRILAASVKTPDQAVTSLLDGAHQLTLPANVLNALHGHPLTDSAVEEFMRAASA
jgi:transaldolase